MAKCCEVAIGTEVVLAVAAVGLVNGGITLLLASRGRCVVALVLVGIEVDALRRR